MTARFKFVDLFSGIGGFHLGAKQNGGECILSCEVNKIASNIYEKNYHIKPCPDVYKLKKLPNADLLCAGFPCQPFSKLGKRQGFKDAQKGDLFREIIRLVKTSHPKVILLENVKEIKKIKNGQYEKQIIHAIGKLNYQVTIGTYNSKFFGVGQSRGRWYLVAAKNKKFIFPKHPNIKTPIKKILDKNNMSKEFNNLYEWKDYFFKKYENDKSLKISETKDKSIKITIKKEHWSGPRIRALLINTEYFHPCLIHTSNYFDFFVKFPNIRKLNKKELCRLQGFPDSFDFEDLSANNISSLLGNAVTVNVIDYIIKNMIKQNIL